MEAIMKDTYISEAIKYIGADDTTLDLFESQYQIPNGVSYNSYVILDEKVAVMDTIDERKTDEWFANLENVLNGRTVDYLVIMLIFILQNLRCPLRAVPDFIDNILIEFRFMTYQKDTAAVFLQRAL